MQMQPFFTDDQLILLQQILLTKHVKNRTQGGGKVDYIEGVTAIEHANKIFGFGMWSSEIVSLAPCYQDDSKLTMQATVRITVHSPFDYNRTIACVDVGYGQGSANKSSGSFADAFEKAGKEAATDALKRTLRLLGNQFGLALYDKEQAQVGTEEDQEEIDKARLAIRNLSAYVKADEMKLVTNMIDELRAVYREIKAREKANAHVEG